MSLLDRIVDRVTSRHERHIAAGEHYRDDNDDLGGVLGNLYTEYRLAIQRGADREELGSILMALGGCEIASAHLYRGMKWDQVAPGHARATYMSGLLVQEIAATALEGPGYRGVRHPDLQREPLAVALRQLAVKFAGPHVPVRRYMTAVMDAVRGDIPGQPTETLAVLVDAHPQGLS